MSSGRSFWMSDSSEGNDNNWPVGRRQWTGSEQAPHGPKEVQLFGHRRKLIVERFRLAPLDQVACKSSRALFPRRVTTDSGAASSVGSSWGTSLCTGIALVKHNDILPLPLTAGFLGSRLGFLWGENVNLYHQTAVQRTCELRWNGRHNVPFEVRGCWRHHGFLKMKKKLIFCVLG
jgi:hypothetical protein